MAKPGSRSFLLPLFLGLTLFFASCGTTEELKDEEMERLLDEKEEEYSDLTEQLDDMSTLDESMEEVSTEELEARAEELLSELPDLAVNLESYRSRLYDQHDTFRNEIPERYLEELEEDDQRANNRGYRIQIISTRDARLAEDIREDFQEWISSVSAPPHARTYMVFQQPYYRVQVGDFIDRGNAMEFTEFLRLRYPDAWVVHSRIHPGRVQQ